jgi:hypothetical protein
MARIGARAGKVSARALTIARYPVNIGREEMTHIRTISRCRPEPGKAQFESLLQLVGLLSAILALINNFVDTFFPEKR